MLVIKQSGRISGRISVPGDKSVSHRAVMFAAISEGRSEVRGFLQGGDCLSTISCFRALGIEIDNNGDRIIVNGKGLYGLRKPSEALDAGNSGTTARLLSGILAGQSFVSEITGDSSLCSRPMRRVAEPLRLMGAEFTGSGKACTAPFRISGGALRAVQWTSPVASAQVKSAILLAGLYADGETSVTEPFLSRDHSERMLRAFGAAVASSGNRAAVIPGNKMIAARIDVPGDISSAAFFMVAAALQPDAELLIQNVGVNPTRTGIIDVLQQMGAVVELDNIRVHSGEPVADIFIRGANLHATEIGAALIPRLVDEIPAIAVLAMHAEGDTVISGASELRVKESDRLAVIAGEFRKFGAAIEELPDGLVISGKRKLQGTVIDSHHDHRIAMAAAIAGLHADGSTQIRNNECINISFPGFDAKLASIIGRERT